MGEAGSPTGLPVRGPGYLCLPRGALGEEAQGYICPGAGTDTQLQKALKGDWRFRLLASGVAGPSSWRLISVASWEEATRVLVPAPHRQV